MKVIYIFIFGVCLYWFLDGFFKTFRSIKNGFDDVCGKA